MQSKILLGNYCKMECESCMRLSKITCLWRPIFCRSIVDSKCIFLEGQGTYPWKEPILGTCESWMYCSMTYISGYSGWWFGFMPLHSRNLIFIHKIFYLFWSQRSKSRVRWRNKILMILLKTELVFYFVITTL